MSGQHELGVLYSSVPRQQRAAQHPASHPLPPLLNVDQINPAAAAAAAMLSLDNQLTLQVLKTDSLVSFA